ncbi:MAG TPA: outer membrane protein assembly factor BamD, partial [Bacteroidales bacterium]|nr:outer membrane protein assembly factor BamD [Bacteroidales bacterium]
IVSQGATRRGQFAPYLPMDHPDMNEFLDLGTEGNQIQNVYRGNEKAEKIDYYYAYCTYFQGDILMAAYYFNRFIQTYPLSKHKEECEFMSAYCLYEYSPSPSLDQTYTNKAIDHFQLFLTHYPNSEKKDSVNHLIRKLVVKLQTKEFNNSKLFFKLGNYKSAVVALNNVLLDYPDIKNREEILFLILKSNFLYAENSVVKKKAERYQKTIESYFTLIDQFPETKYLKEAQRIYKQSSKYIKQS